MANVGLDHKIIISAFRQFLKFSIWKGDWFRIGFFWSKVWIFITDVGSRLNFIRHKCKTCRPYQFKFFKSGLPQILFGPFLNVLSQKLIKHFFEHGCSEIYLGSCQKSLTEHSSKIVFRYKLQGWIQLS